MCALRKATSVVVRLAGATYAWQFPGGVPTNTDQAETDVLYAEPGSYSVTLTVTDANGNADTFTWENMITVTNDPIAMPLAEDFQWRNFPVRQTWKNRELRASGNSGTANRPSPMPLKMAWRNSRITG